MNIHVEKILAIALILIIAGCSEQKENKEPAHPYVGMPTYAVTGSVVKGPADSASLALYAIDDKGERVGAAIHTATTDSQGNWSLAAPSGVVPLLIVASGGSFVDESDTNPDATEKRKITLEAGDELYGILPAGSQTASVTFTTHVLYQQIKRYCRRYFCRGIFNKAR
jgi:hypothetical protein